MSRPSSSTTSRLSPVPQYCCLLVDLTAGKDVSPLRKPDQVVDGVGKLHLGLHGLGGEVVVEVEDVGVVLQVAVRGDPHYASAGLHIGLGK